VRRHPAGQQAKLSWINMCGIAGILAKDSINITHSVTLMNEALAHRGPDADGLELWRYQNRYQAAFAHRRLAIIDLSPSGKQPMATADRRYSITFNGEIYNYLALRAQLEGDGVSFATDTDTEVLLRLYEKHGKDCLRFLQGMFAFALRDSQTGDVFIARDRLGIKPLYYYAGNSLFLFASEIRALLASGLLPRLIDNIALHSFLSFGAVQEPRTMIEGVRSLPPAHYLIINGEGRIKELARYWRLPDTQDDEKCTVTAEESIAETRARLEESIRLHMLADVPLGAFLSGGIDSSAIVALMSKQASRQVNTFTVCFAEQEFSERELAGRVAKRWNTAHTEIILSEQEMLASLPQAVSDIDQPSIDGINSWVISRATKQAGITVALSGLGGDELFGGYPSFRRALKLERYGAPIRWLGNGARGQVAALTSKLMGDTLQSQKIAAAISAGSDLLSTYTSMRGLFSKATCTALINSRSDAFQNGGDYDLPVETLALMKEDENGKSRDDVFNRISRYEMNLYMANMLLRDTDAMSMASALEVRVPLLDHKLVEWVYGLPGYLKIGQHPKQLLIDACGADLLPEIVGTKKKGFALPFERWLHTALKPFVAQTLGDNDAVKQAGLNAQAVADVISRFESGSRATSWSRVWGLAVLVAWCKRHQVEVAEE
jgi:asparagine synthase (glutamine-hydrolysing)